MASRRKPPETGQEFIRIARYFAPLAKDFPGALGLTDDAALLSAPPGFELAVTTDALVEGVHFVGDEPASLIARKALRVNLSDLAAMGAVPLSYTLALVLPARFGEPWLADFAAGLMADQREYGIAIAGGDSVSTPGPLTLSITAFGTVPEGKALRRSGARPGDLVYVSGTIGDGALGLAGVREQLGDLPPRARADLIDRYRLPRPRTTLGTELVGVASAAIDISDGLVADLGHIAETSGVAIDVEAGQIPLSPAAMRAVGNDPSRRKLILSGGDDYELALTIAPEHSAILSSLASKTGVRLTRIGIVGQGTGASPGEIIVRDESGSRIALDQPGYRHF
jgi:thiamine-monophosphate kinase